MEGIFDTKPKKEKLINIKENSIVNGNCFNILRKIKKNTINVILSDPPYGLTDCKWDIKLDLEKLWRYYKRVLKETGVVILTASQPFTSKLIMSNLTWFRYEWIWVKTQGNFLDANKQPLKRHENIIIFSKKRKIYNPQKIKGKSYKVRSGSPCKFLSKRKRTDLINKVTINKGDRYPTSIIKFPNETGLHPTQKPVNLFIYLIKTYSKEGDLILDNFAGSGTTGIACIKTNRRFILIEKDQEYCKIIANRTGLNIYYV